MGIEDLQMTKNRTNFQRLVTLRNFLFQNAVARQIGGGLHSVTWVVSQYFCCAKRCMKQNLALLFATYSSNWQHHCTVYHPSSNLSRNFTAVLTKAHAHTSCFSFRGALRDKLLRKLHSVTGSLDLQPTNFK